MIVRIWRGQAERVRTQAYHDHVTGRVFPELTKISGHRGAYLLRREAGARVEFLAVTLWDSLESIKAFAGAAPDVAADSGCPTLVVRASAQLLKQCREFRLLR